MGTKQKKSKNMQKMKKKLSKNYTTQSTYYFVDEHTYLIRKKKKTEHKKEKKLLQEIRGLSRACLVTLKNDYIYYILVSFFFGQTLFLPPLFLLFFAIYIYLSKRHIILPFGVRKSVPIYLILIKLNFFSKKAICI